MITIKYSEVTGEIIAECGRERQNVTDDILRAMEETGRLPKEGHWEIRPERDDIIACSACKTIYTRKSLKAVTVLGQKLPRCCPNCGGRMVEPQESEDKE